MIVEFLSCSATGKSTVNKMLRQAFGAPKRVNAPAGSIKHYPDQREKFRQALAKMGNRVLEIEHNRQRRCLNRRFNGHWWVRGNYRGKLICWDEGTIQCLGSLFHTYNKLPKYTEIIEMLNGWPLPDLVVILDVDKKLVLDRKIKRDNHLPEEYDRISKHFDIQNNIIKLFIPAFDEMRIPYFKLPNNFDSPEELIESKKWKDLLTIIETELKREKH